MGVYYYRPYSYLLNAIEHLLYRFKRKRAEGRCRGDWHARVHCLNWDLVERSLTEIATISRRHNIPVFFVVIPVYYEDPGKVEQLVTLNRELLALAGRNQLKPLDLWEVFHNKEDGLWKKQHWLNGWHPSETGHKIIAGFLLQKLIGQIH